MGKGRGKTRKERPALTWLLAAGRIPYLVLLSLLTVFLANASLGLRVEREGESMTSRRLDRPRADADFRRLFGGDEELLLAVTRPDLLSPDGLRLLDELTERIAGMDGVRRVVTLTNARQALPGPEGPESAPLVPRPLDAPESAEEAVVALVRNPQYEGLLVSRDRSTAGILIEIEDRPGDEGGRGRPIEEIRALMERRSGEARFHLTGIAVQKHDVSEYIRRDQTILIPLSALVLSGVLALATRRVAGVLIPLAATAVSLAWTMGLYALTGRSLNIVTAMLPPVVMVLSVETAVHLYFGGVRAAGGAAERALRLARETGALLSPCFFSALTTALGFLSLAASDTPAVRQFGAAGAVGVMISFAVGVTLVPVLLSFLPAPKAGSPGLRPSPARGGALRGVARLASAWPRAVLAAALLLTSVAAAGIPRIRNNTDLVRFLKADAPLRRDTEIVDARLAGTSSLEFLVVRKDWKPLTSLDDVRRIAAFQKAALEDPQVTAAYSIADAIRLLHRAATGGSTLALPGDQAELLAACDLLEAAPDRGLAGKLISRDFTAARVSVRTRAMGTAEAAPLVRKLAARGEVLFGEGYLFAPAGSFLQVVEDSNRLVSSQVSSFALSFGTIMVVLALLFRSRRLTLIALLPNLVPLLITAGLMGFLRIDLSTATAMIASVVFGLIVDNTIHYVVRFRREYRGDAREAVMAATAGVGRPVAVSCFALVAGFWVGAFGSFNPTIHFSLLTGITMISALACVLTVLPAALVLSDRGARTKAP